MIPILSTGGFLLDTNFVSEVVRVRPDPRVLEWMAAAEERTLYLSVLTLGEIRKGIFNLPEGKRRTRLEAWLEIDLRTLFGDRILPVDADIADRWGVLAGQAMRRGTPLDAIDGLLAATALQHNLTVVTRNESDFLQTSVRS